MSKTQADKNGQVTQGTPTLAEAMQVIAALQAQLGAKPKADAGKAVKPQAEAKLEGGYITIRMPVATTGHVSSTGKSMVHATTSQSVGDYKFSLTVYKKI